MVARVAGVFDEKLTEAIANSKILVVGAGGIGCEILKNLVLTGFPYIEIVCIYCLLLYFPTLTLRGQKISTDYGADDVGAWYTMGIFYCWERCPFST